MKKDEMKKWQEATIQEIEEKLKDFSSKLYNLRYKVKLGQQKDYASIKKMKRDVARLKTIARERTINSVDGNKELREK